MSQITPRWRRGLVDLLAVGAACAALRWFGLRWGLAAVGGIVLLLVAGRALVCSTRRPRPALGDRRPTLVLTEVLVATITCYAVNGLWLSLPLPVSFVAVFAASRMLVPWALGLHRYPEPGSRVRAWSVWLLGQGLCVSLQMGASVICAWPQTGWLLFFGGGLIPTAAAALYRAIRLHGGNPPFGEEERVRRVALGTGVLALAHPYLSNRFMGASDAKFYAEAMQDFLAQLHAGIFPVWISQTEIAPFGTVFPFRMASYHFYLGALLDLLTGRTLNVYAVQHLTLVVSMAGGAYVMYRTLAALAPQLRWESAALAFLYVACPGWLAALYGKDMYFTAMTLPWLPVVMYAMAQTFRRKHARDFALLGGALALVWLAHPPVGFCASAAVVAVQLGRLALQPPSWRDLLRLGLALATCLVLCAGLFVSLYDVRVAGVTVNSAPVVLRVLGAEAHNMFLPVSGRGDLLGDFQIGYALQLLLLLSFWGPRETRRERWVLAAVAGALLLFIYPVPVITPALWRSMPNLVGNITNIWPMQRICPLVAAIVPFAAVSALAAWSSVRVRRAVLAILCAWSAFEAATFVRRGVNVTFSEEATRVKSKVENSPFLSAWAGYAPPLPPDINLFDRVNDPRLFNRLLNAKDQTELVSNYLEAARSGRSPFSQRVVADAVPLATGVMRIQPAVTLQPGQRYQFIMHFGDPTAAGVLQLMALDLEPRFYQEIALPPGQPRSDITATLWTSETEAVPLAFLFRSADSAYAASLHARFLTYRLEPYDAATLPIRVTSLAPYEAVVDAPQDCYLETHRFFSRGYRATVNGHPAAVSESPRHFAMLPLPPGHDDVRLDYVAPPAVRAAYWFSLTAWAGLAVWGLVRLGAHLRARIRLSPGP